MPVGASGRNALAQCWRYRRPFARGRRRPDPTSSCRGRQLCSGICSPIRSRCRSSQPSSQRSTRWRHPGSRQTWRRSSKGCTPRGRSSVRHECSPLHSPATLEVPAASLLARRVAAYGLGWLGRSQSSRIALGRATRSGRMERPARNGPPRAHARPARLRGRRRRPGYL